MMSSTVNNSRQMFTARSFDGNGEGHGLGLCIEHEGRQTDVSMEPDEARQFLSWLREQEKQWDAHRKEPNERR